MLIPIWLASLVDVRSEAEAAGATAPDGYLGAVTIETK